MLEIRLLGQFEVRRDRLILDIPSRPGQSLLAYLALHPGVPHRREKLAGLLWPDSAERQARANLRAALWRIRKSLNADAPDSPSHVLASGIDITFDDRSGCWVDAAGLQSTVAGETIEHLMEVASAYRGELLPGFYDEWIVAERERLQMAYEQRMRLLIERLLESGRWTDVLEWGERWLAFGGTSEAAYRGLMAAYAGLGDLASAQAAYERCAQALRRDLDVEPSEETQTLLAQLTSATAPPQASHPASNLPLQPTPFIGRDVELAEVARLLASPECRLLTLIGPGGIGKTRLALQAAASLSAESRVYGGAYFVPLASLASPRFIVLVIADALRYKLSGTQEPREQLLEWLAPRRLLLVLDNFEHLLDGAALLADILAVAPEVKILATSRERLNLRGEWIYVVEGMRLPPDDGPAKLEENDAIQLFLASARRAQPRFGLADADRPLVGRICRLVDGAPLAIELAAASLRMLTCAEIAAGIEQNLDFLSSPLRDAPERHRSLRATFDHSWNLLNAAEQAAFRRLSVFRGGFERSAAAQAAGVPAPLLGDLVDKSLVQRTAAGRFDMHSLLRQYAAERLAEAGELDVYCWRHQHFFLALAQEAETGLRGRDQLAWGRRIEVEYDNERAALAWSLYQEDAESALQLASALAEFWWRQGRLLEGSDWLERALALSSPAPAPIRARAIFRAAQLRGEAGDRHEAVRLGEQSLALAQQAGDRRGQGWALRLIGVQQHFLGDSAAAASHLQESLALSREVGDTSNLGAILLVLADLHMRQGDVEQAAALYEEALGLYREVGDAWGIAWALGGRADTARLQGDYDRAGSLLREGLTLHLEHGYRMDAAYTLEALALLALARHRPMQAARLWGVADALRDEIHAPLPPAYQRDYKPHLDKLRAELSHSAFEAAWAEGRAMTPEQALAYAGD